MVIDFGGTMQETRRPRCFLMQLYVCVLKIAGFHGIFSQNPPQIECIKVTQFCERNINKKNAGDFSQAMRRTKT